MVSRWAWRLTSGRCSVIRMPGTVVAIGLNSPRTSAGASGFMSQTSSWLGPPWSRNRMHERTRVRGARSLARSSSGSDRPKAPNPPSCSKRRRVSADGWSGIGSTRQALRVGTRNLPAARSVPTGDTRARRWAGDRPAGRNGSYPSRVEALMLRCNLPRRLFQFLYHLIDIVLISRRSRKRRFQNVRDVPFSIDDKPVRIILHPAAPTQGAARNAIKRGCTTGRVRQRRGEDHAFFLAEWPFAASEQPVLLFEDSGSIPIQRQHHIGGRAQFFDAVFLEAQLRLLVHSAASAVEGGEIDGDGLFAEDRRQLEGFSVNGQGREIRGGLSHDGRTHCFASDPGLIGLPNLRRVVDLTLELAGHELGDPRYAGVAILLRRFDHFGLHLEKREGFDCPDANHILFIVFDQRRDRIGRGLISPNAERVGGNGPHKRVAVVEGCSQRRQVSRINDVVVRCHAVFPALVEVLVIGRKLQLAVALDWRWWLRTSTCGRHKKQTCC